MEQKGEKLTYVQRGNVHTLVSSKAQAGRQVKNEPEESKPQLSRRDLIKGLIGALALGVLYLAQKKVLGSGAEPRQIKTEDINAEIERFKRLAESGNRENPFDTISHNLSEIEQGVARSIVYKMKHEVLLPHPSFEGMMAVTRKYEGNIRTAASENNFPLDLALGIVFIENGGAEDLTSEAGARGPAQLMPDTARRFGLRVDGEVDERIDPDKCFRAMCQYLSQMRTMFGDVGLAVWGYHAGEGNVYDALWVYFKDVEGVDLGNFLAATSSEEAQGIAKAYSEKISQSKVSIHKILSNEAVKSKVLNFLGDETELYPYKAVAAAEILQEADKSA